MTANEQQNATNPTPIDTMSPLLERLRKQIEQREHRQLFVISGSENECVTLACDYLRFAATRNKVLWSGSGAPDYVTSASMHRLSIHLGGEYDFVVVNLHHVARWDSVALLEGVVVAGGAMILLTPAFANWPATAQRHCNPQQPNNFLKRFCRELLQATTDIDQSRDCEIRALTIGDQETTPIQNRFLEQNRLIQVLCEHAKAESKKCLLLSADRGRGKSATLGRCIAWLLNHTATKIVISAPNKRATDILMHHMQLDLNAEKSSGNCQFLPPDALLHYYGTVDLLVIDEAAGIPISLLLELARRYQRTILSTTVKGYEGAGRGFAIRFHHLLSEHNIPWHHEKLVQPIRWREGDPLEATLQRLFMTNLTLPEVDRNQLAQIHTSAKLKFVSANELYENEKLLQDIFGLLIQAHYKTTPNDLQHLLEHNNLEIAVLILNRYVVGAVLIAREGQIEETRLRQGIMSKTRRPVGNVLPQLLAQFTATAEYLDLTFARIVRIAIHPNLQRLGFGSRLLGQLSRHYTERGIDSLGAMFSAVPHTISFWDKNGYHECHKGARKQTSSGLQSITMLKPLSNRARRLVPLARALHIDHESFRDGAPSPSNNADAALLEFHITLLDPLLLRQFGLGQRSFRDSHASLARLGKSVIELGARHSALREIVQQHHELISALQLPHATPGSLSKLVGEKGQKSMEATLRQFVNNCLKILNN